MEDGEMDGQGMGENTYVNIVLGAIVRLGRDKKRFRQAASWTERWRDIKIEIEAMNVPLR